MNCSKVKENLSAFIDGELGNSESSALKAHLIRCQECRNERDQIEKIGASLRVLQPKTAPKDFEYRIYAGIHTRIHGTHVNKFIRWKTALASIPALVIGFLIGAWQFNPAVPFIASDSQKEQIASTLDSLPIVQDDEYFTEYTMSAYISDQQNEMTELKSDEGLIPSQPPQSAEPHPKLSSPRYVLDPVPVLASYERTVY